MPLEIRNRSMAATVGTPAKKKKASMLNTI